MRIIYCIFIVILAIALAFLHVPPTIALSSSSHKEYIDPPTLYSGVEYGFSQAIATQGKTTIYLSGQVAWDVQKRTIGIGNLAVQTQKALENLELALAASGATPNDVVQIEVFVIDYKSEDADIIAEAMGAFFGKTLPTSTLIGVQALAYPDLLIEIKATAVLN
ncbi:RidA family protein [Gloeocapsa sp. BRSZ]